MIGTLTRDMSTSIVGSGENVQSSEYVYDHMGRLMTGSIEFVGKVGNKYDVSTSYNKAGGLESKVSSPDASAQVFAGTSQEMTYDLTYQYSGTNPHQLSEVISSQGVPYAMSFAYNASGSISEITDMMGVDHSSYYWGQEQWLCGVENTQGMARYHHPKLSVWMSVDPLAHQTLEAYQFTGNNPIALIDPDGRCPDCPNGEYQIQEGDTFWDLEAKWNMDHGSLSQMNPALNPRALQIGQSIRTVLNESDLPNGVQLHSSNSLNGMDNFFIPGAEGVNKLRIISDEEYNDLINQLAAGNPRDAAWGEQGDAKMQFINNKDQYSNNTQAWFNDQNSVTEPATRYLFIYQNYAYNINEFGNLAFGSANSKTGNVSLNTLLIGGHVYSLFMNGQWDDINEVRAVKRGYKLYPGYQSKQFNGDYIPYMP
jgi:RHS repeat-associated protein